MGVLAAFRPWHMAAIIAVFVLAVYGSTTLVRADHGDPDFINLASSPGLDETHEGAIFTQGGLGAGTGTFDPFLTLQSNEDTESGYNSDDSLDDVPEFDEFYGGSRTHVLNAAAVPTIDVVGTLYREFTLDANDEGGDDFMSIDTFKVFLDETNDGQVFGYIAGADTFA